MNRTDIQNNSYADCPIRMILARISDKWSILTLFTLTQAPVMRFNELQKTIPDISQKMLTVTLRTLEEDGLVRRQIYAQVPPKVEYSLTERAMSLLPLSMTGKGEGDNNNPLHIPVIAKIPFTSLSRISESPYSVRNKPIHHPPVPGHFQVIHSSHHVR